MTRTFDPQSVIELPRFDSDSIISIVTALLTLASHETALPANVQAARDLLKSAVDSLQGTKMPTAPVESKLLEALRAEATGWTALEKFLDALAGVPGPKAAKAGALRDALFPDGLSFLRGKALKRWPLTEARIQHLAAKDVVAAVKAVGADDLVAHVVQTHAATGAAAGITAPKAAVELPQVRERLDDVKAAMRAYVAQFVANAGIDKTGAAQALTDKLLKPLADFVPASAVKAPAEAVPAPQADPAPAA